MISENYYNKLRLRKIWKKYFLPNFRVTVLPILFFSKSIIIILVVKNKKVLLRKFENKRAYYTMESVSKSDYNHPTI